MANDHRYEQIIRMEWWRNHGCASPTDATFLSNDGEMKCSKCGTDFRRMHFDDLERQVEYTRLKAVGSKISNRNSEILADFAQYCEQHPDERFWQALRNWSEYAYIYAGNVDMEKIIKTLEKELAQAEQVELGLIDIIDTFAWEGKRHDHHHHHHHHHPPSF